MAENISSKRRAEDDDVEEPPRKQFVAEGPNATVVATHYNSLEEKGLAERFKSKIFFMRNFNNWTKSMLINEFLEKLRKADSRRQIKVLDMCCGKGGDLLKWQKSNIAHLICTDIADVSVNQAEERYLKMRERQPRIFSAEFLTADATHVSQRERYRDPDIGIDLTSCQFAFHYCFESLGQAEQMLKNASELLRPGGYFIGTIPDANEIMKRSRAADSAEFGNDIYQIKLQFDTAKPPPLFGAKYDFHLEEVVDCPEFLVHFPTFVKLAEVYGLKLVQRYSFEDYYYKSITQGKPLVEKMRALETYFIGSEQLSYAGDEEYQHAKDLVEEKTNGKGRVGTLSRSEWEVVCE